MTGEGGRAPGGIGALDAALLALRAFAAFDRPASLGELAREAGMPSPKLHRYLQSFVHAGLAVRREPGGRYDLGPLAAELGLAAVARNDVVNRAADGLEGLVAETGMTALLSVWGPPGATVVRWQRAPSPLVTSFGLGSAFPLLSSATGRVFLAFLPPGLTRARLDDELRLIGGGVAAPPDLEPTADGVARLAAGVRAARAAAVDGRFIPGLRAAAAPVTNWQGEAELAVTLVGTDDALLDPAGGARAALRRFTDALSLRSP